MLGAILLSIVSIRTVDAVGATVEVQLTKMENDWADSYVKRDPLFVQKITTDDFMFVGPDGNIVNKADYVKGVTGDTTFTAFKFKGARLRRYCGRDRNRHDYGQDQRGR